LLAATLWALVKRPAAGFLGASFFAILGPSSSILPIATETMAERRMYLALIPVVALVVLEIHRRLGRATLPITLVLAAGLGLTAAHRNRDYISEQAIWSDTVGKRPENARARNNLGTVLLNVPGRLKDAIAQYEEALRLKPDFAEAHYNLGNALENLPGRLKDAIAQYEEALRLQPYYPDACLNLGNALVNVPGRLNDAIAQYQEALRLKPDFAEAHFSLGAALLHANGNRDEARAQLEAGLRIHPDDARARQLLASIPP
jgi:tetratricopeptide (TPR) repeat protein